MLSFFANPGLLLLQYIRTRCPWVLIHFIHFNLQQAQYQVNICSDFKAINQILNGVLTQAFILSTFFCNFSFKCLWKESVSNECELIWVLVGLGLGLVVKLKISRAKRMVERWCCGVIWSIHHNLTFQQFPAKLDLFIQNPIHQFAGKSAMIQVATWQIDPWPSANWHQISFPKIWGTQPSLKTWLNFSS